MRAVIGIAFVAVTATSCVIGGDEPWDDNAGGDTDTDTDSDTDTDGDGDSDDGVGLEAADDGSLHLMPDAGPDAG